MILPQYLVRVGRRVQIMEQRRRQQQKLETMTMLRRRGLVRMLLLLMLCIRGISSTSSLILRGTTRIVGRTRGIGSTIISRRTRSTLGRAVWRLRVGLRVGGRLRVLRRAVCLLRARLGAIIDIHLGGGTVGTTRTWSGTGSV